MVNPSRRNSINTLVNLSKIYSLHDGIRLLKKYALSTFIESIDVAINLNIDVRKPEQNIRGVAYLPHGTGKKIIVAVFAYGNDAKIAKSVGADFVGTEDLVEQILTKKIKFNSVVSSVEAMSIVNKLGPVLGPRGLMPNPKFGTITSNISETIKKIKAGQIYFRNDKNGIIHSSIGKINFDIDKIKENLESLLFSLRKLKPISVTGAFFKKISISTTMGVGISIDQTDLYPNN